MEQAYAIRHRTQDLVGREEATIVVRKLTVAQLREQPQSLYGWHALCHSGAAVEVSPPPPTTDLNAAMTA